MVDYEPLPAVVDLESAETGQALFEDAGTNLAFDMSAMFGFVPADDLFDGCDVVVRQRIVNQRVAPCPMEVRAAAAFWGDDGRLTQWASTQAPNSLRTQLAGALGLEESRGPGHRPRRRAAASAPRRRCTPRSRCSAGSPRQVGRPVRWVETRTESMLTLGHGRGQIQFIELGGTADGKLLAFRNRDPAGLRRLPGASARSCPC